jgi:endoglucanase
LKVSIKIQLAIIISFFTAETLFSQNTNGFLRRQNTQFINNDGVVVLKGVNLGNWLHIEPYMINAPTAVAGSYESLHAAIANVTGSSSQANAFFTTWRNNFIQKKDIDSIAAMGFNHVRVPFPYQLFYNTTTNTYSTEGFVYLDNVVNWCKLNNIYAILDLHHAPGGQIDGALWSNYITNKEITKQIWKNIALHYATETAIGGYDILNEPLISLQSEQWKLKDLYQAITTEIRSVDTNHLLFFEGNWYASSFWELTDGTPSTNDRWDENMAFSQHVYWVPQPSSTNQWTNTIANALNIPKWCGEGGENANHWLNEWVNDCENTNSSWCLWTYKKAGGISSLYSNPYNTNYQAVLDFWNGGAQPSQANAINGLQQFAQQSDLDFCSFKKDVKDAVLRQNFNTTALPFFAHILPTTIQAVNYDMGANGIAYNDTVFQSTGQGTNFTNYNNGWTYRNDGVDIETWTGSPSIGSIDTNEWLQYTVQVPHGQYEVSLQYAAPNAGAKIELLSNENTIIPEVTLGATGGWGSWQWNVLGTIPILAQSDFKIKLKVIQNGLNIKALKFDFIEQLDTPTYIIDKPIVTFSKEILKINSVTQIKEITIYDALGKLVKKDENLNASVISLPFEFSKGMYFIRIIDENHSFWNLKFIN